MPVAARSMAAVVVDGGTGIGGGGGGGAGGGAGGSSFIEIKLMPPFARGVMVELECSQQAVPRPNVANVHFGAAAAHCEQHELTELATIWL